MRTLALAVSLLAVGADAAQAQTAPAPPLPQTVRLQLRNQDYVQGYLRGRSKDDEEAVKRRLQVARDEVSAFEEYDYIVVNDDLEPCVERMRAIVMAERAKLECMRGEADRIIGTF